MKTLNIILLITVLFCNNLYSQVNLVPNPSFEEYINCPIYSGIDEFVVDWTNPTSYSPDYFNACANIISPNFGVPNNDFGVQNARTGNAYIGLISMIETDAREYIQTELKQILIAEKKYLVTFYVSLSENSPYASNNIGAYFSEIPVSSLNSQVLPYYPQISNNSISSPLISTLDWVKISDTLIAFGGEKYMTIGNFNDDASTDTTHLNQGWNAMSYHFIDDVSVICLDCNVGILTLTDNNITIYPNPATDYLTINSNNIDVKKLTILNSLGIPLFVQEKIFAISSLKIDISTYESGIYFLKIETSNTFTTTKFLITK